MSSVPNGPYIPQIYDASDPDVKTSAMQAAINANVFQYVTFNDTGEIANYRIQSLDGRIEYFPASGGSVETLAFQSDLPPEQGKSPVMTYSGNLLTQVLYQDGTRKTLSYASGKLTRVDWVRVSPLPTIRKDLAYDGDILQSVTESFI